MRPVTELIAVKGVYRSVLAPATRAGAETLSMRNSSASRLQLALKVCWMLKRLWHEDIVVATSVHDVTGSVVFPYTYICTNAVFDGNVNVLVKMIKFVAALHVTSRRLHYHKERESARSPTGVLPKYMPCNGG